LQGRHDGQSAAPHITGWIQSWNPPERCPRPLYSRDSTQEGHTIPHHHQSGILGDDNIDVKEEYKEEDEEYGVMEEFSEGHKDMMEPPNTRNPPERCPRPLYSRDSTQEGHTIPHYYKSGNLRDPKAEVKEEIKRGGDEDGGMEKSELPEGHHGGVIQIQEPTREISPSSVFLGFHTGRSHHPSLLQEWRSNRYRS
ncbi:unnamed protein product, partial [Staurois parvus]